ncbi:hypothetical protein ACLOJK_020145, partial [Asimina triloba]
VEMKRSFPAANQRIRPGASVTRKGADWGGNVPLLELNSSGLNCSLEKGGKHGKRFFAIHSPFYLFPTCGVLNGSSIISQEMSRIHTRRAFLVSMVARKATKRETFVPDPDYRIPLVQKNVKISRVMFMCYR